MATDAPALVKYLQQRSGHDDDLLHIDELIRQLGNADFKARRQAAEKLLAVGPPAHARLLEVQKDKDKERARGAKEAADEINRAWNFGLNLTVVRRLVKITLSPGTVQGEGEGARRGSPDPAGSLDRRPPARDGRPAVGLSAGSGDPRTAAGDAARALLQFLPYAADPECEEEIWFGLDTLAGGQGSGSRVRKNAGNHGETRILENAATSLPDSLKDKLPIRRAAAGYLFTRRGNADQRAAGKKLLADPDPVVRLRTAQGLLGAKDKDAIPVLIELLEKLRWTEEAWQAEEMLHYVAGDDSPEATIGAGSAKARQNCRKAWQEWWKTNQTKIDLAKLDQDHRRPMLVSILVQDRTYPFKEDGRLVLLGCDGTVRWQLGNLSNPSAMQLIVGDRVFVAEQGGDDLHRRPSAGGTHGIGVRDLNGQVLWQYREIEFQTACRHLPNEETVILAGGGGTATKLSPEHKPTFVHGATRIVNGRIEDFSLHGVQILDRDRILCALNFGKGPEFCERDLGTGNVRKRVLLQEEYKYPYTVEALPGRGYLVAGPNLHPSVEELDGKGKKVWELASQWVLQAVRLHSGNTVILSGATEGIRVIEVVPDSTVVGEIFAKGSPRRFSVILPLVALGFDHPRPADLNLATSIPYRIKGLKSKNAFIRLMSTCLLYELGAKALPAAQELIDALDDPEERVRSWAEGTLGKIGTAVLPQVLAASEDKRANVRASVAWILGEFPIEAKRTVPVLIALLRDKETSVRRKAAWSLGRIGPEAKAAIPALVEALKDPDMGPEIKDVRVSGGAAFALGRIGRKAKAAVPALIKAIKSGDPNSQALRINALVRIAPNDKDVFETLIQLLKQREDLGTRADAANALGFVGSKAKDAVPMLIDLLNVSDEKKSSLSATARKIAALTLGKIGKEAKDAILALERALSDPDPGVRSEAAVALKKIKP